MDTKRTKIFLSDPQVLFREGIHFILSGEDDFEVIGEATGNEDTVTRIEANPPQLVILSMEDKKLAGPEAVRQIKRRLPAVAAIMTIEKKDEDQLLQVISSGASAFLTKDIDPEHLLDTVRDVSQGGLPLIDELLGPVMAARVLAEFEDVVSLNRGMDNLLAGLTPKETQVLEAIAGGSSLAQVSAKLDVNEDSVRNHLKLALNKLAANDLTRSVIITVQRSLSSVISPPSRSKMPPDDYLTQEEFARFKETLARRLSDVVGETV